MKKLSKLFIVGILAITMVMGQGTAAMAEDQSDYIALIEEEMTAQYLYTELSKIYPEVQLFSNLAESEGRHAEALMRSLSRLNVSTDGAKAQDIEIPATLEEALAFALAFEKEDIEMLEELLETVEDSRLERVLNNLLNGSNQHYNTIKKAIEEGVDNLNCDGDGTRKYKNRDNNLAGNRNEARNAKGGGRGRGSDNSTGRGAGRGSDDNTGRGRGGRGGAGRGNDDNSGGGRDRLHKNSNRN
ncbi:MAG: DUF2202 domain-containing protein [Christensenellaceae bacterium]|nr:DUF2202 domain-containing protein [Christensenellaceae bacterium]